MRPLKVFSILTITLLVISTSSCKKTNNEQASFISSSSEKIKNGSFSDDMNPYGDGCITVDDFGEFNSHLLLKNKTLNYGKNRYTILNVYAGHRTHSSGIFSSCNAVSLKIKKLGENKTEYLRLTSTYKYKMPTGLILSILEANSMHIEGVSVPLQDDLLNALDEQKECLNRTTDCPLRYIVKPYLYPVDVRKPYLYPVDVR